MPEQQKEYGKLAVEQFKALISRLPEIRKQVSWPTHPLWDQITRVFDEVGSNPHCAGLP